MRNVWIIASKEFRQYFISPVAYAIATLIFLILGGIFFINVYFALRGSQIDPDGRLVVGPLVTILLFATPAVTMRLLAEEQRMGTIELLLTAPIRDWEVVVGKWLGALLFMLVVIAFTWVYPFILNRMTDPGIDQGVLVSAYLGLVLLLSSMLAVGVLISAMFKNPVAAFFVALALLLGMWIVGGLGSGTGLASQVVSNLSLVDHYYNNLYRGIINAPDVLYFVSLTVLSLVLGSQVVESRRWR
jgi:ABC-2 type transport system permease protein